MFLACFDMQLESLVERIELRDSDRNRGAGVKVCGPHSLLSTPNPLVQSPNANGRQHVPAARQT